MLLLQGQISPPPPPPKKKKMTLCVIGRVRFERNCSKMNSRHLFPYGGLESRIQVPVPEIRNPRHGVQNPRMSWTPGP